jgi:hypothetical protein
MQQSHMTVIHTEKVPTKKKKITDDQQRHMYDKDREMVKGIFKYYEVPGACMEFVYKQYKFDQLEKYTLWDGEAYTLPLGVAKHLNKNGWYPVHAHAQDANGIVVAKIGQKVRRFGFQSLEFVDIEDLTPQGSPLVTVEKV